MKKAFLDVSRRSGLAALLVAMAFSPGAMAQHVPAGRYRAADIPATVDALVIDIGTDGDVLVVVGQQVYRGRMAAPSRPKPAPAPAPAPVQPIDPAPFPPAPVPVPPIPPLEPSPLGVLAQKYLYNEAVYHRQVANAIRNGPIKTLAEAGKQGEVLHSAAGKVLGAELNNRIKASNGVDATGKITDPGQVAAIFDEVAAAFEAVLKTRPDYLKP